jgi:hypothetical protein
MMLFPSLNPTLPVGVPEPGETGATAAMNVTGWPCTLRFTLEAKRIVVLAFRTVLDSTRDVEPLNLVSPPYTAAILCFVRARFEAV